jgi:molecular chaperone GrpE
MEDKPDMNHAEEEQIKEESKFKNVLKSKKAKAPAGKEEDWHAKYLESNDKFLRLYADFENFRKRTSKEKQELMVTGTAQVITSLLPVMDDFERAIKHAAEGQEIDPMLEGVLLIYNKLRSTLESKGLSEIITLGEPFNTDFHEAVTNIPAPSEDMKGKVVDQLEKGYLLNDKVIRYAKVIVGN